MKTFEQLTEAEQAKAIEKCTTGLLEAIIEGAIRFNDALNKDDLQSRIDAACQEANDKQTPWFTGECIMETAGEDITSMARAEAEDALYAEPEECVFSVRKL